jgi:signal transduction histidine kinase
VVLLPGRERGYVLDTQSVLDHVNPRLAELCAGENFNGALAIGDLRDKRPSPITDTFGLDGLSFFQVVFYPTAKPTPMDFRQHGFAYSMALLVLVTSFASIFVYRAVSQEVRLSQLRADFVSAVSHEFRSPLSSILALAERLESARVRDPEKLTEYYRVIGQDARRLSALVTRLLDFAQIEEGKKVYALERVDLVAIARETIQSSHDTVRQDRIRLCGEEASPLWVRADRTALQHCIQNLIENAAKYSAPDSPIAVTCLAVNGFNAIDVQDRGIGIPLEEQGRIFEKFYRGRQAAGLNVQGVGIGLALVKHVVESHGGSVSVESQPGHGSRFRLRLPTAQV